MIDPDYITVRQHSTITVEVCLCCFAGIKKKTGKDVPGAGQYLKYGYVKYTVQSFIVLTVIAPV